MSSSVLSLFIFACFVTFQVDAARILCAFPFPAVSHQNVFRAFNKEMARRGHELVVITPNPYSDKDRPAGNITEIDVSHTYKILLNLKNEGVFTPKRGVIIDKDGLTSEESGRQMIKMMTEQFKHPEVKKLIANRHKEKFDLVVVEALMYGQTIYGDLFNAPTIMFSSLIGYPDHFETMGAVSRHPLLYPHLYKHKYHGFSFIEKIKTVYDEIVLWKRSEVWNAIENEEMKRIFGKDALTVAELKDRAEMLFLNAHPIMGNNRPVPPNVIYLGAGLHLQPVKELPKDLKEYLDSSKRGVVYVSLGTNVPTSLMDQDLLDAFLNAFAALPYDILWKLDENNIPPERLSKNIKIGKWFPQRDMLMHPNIKAFVTQGGLQSTDEAIDAQVPLVGIPMLGDQWYNTNKYVELGIGVQLDSFTMNADDVLNGITKAVSETSFRKNLKELREVLYDRTQTPIEKAAWWSEYVIRHGGARHIRSPAANMSYYEYFMVDFLLCVAALVLIPVVLIILTLRFIVKQCKGGKKKVKKN